MIRSRNTATTKSCLNYRVRAAVWPVTMAHQENGMKQLWLKRTPWATLLLVALIIGVACSPATTPNGSTSSTAATSLTPILTALEVTVERYRGENMISLGKGQIENIQTNDQIVVAEKGWGQLIFADHLKVELHHDTRLDIEDVSLDLEQESIFLQIKQIVGSSRVELSKAARDRVELVTDHATLTTIGAPAIFTVCQAEPVTCMFAEAGQVSVKAQNEEVIISAGMGTFILKGQPPTPPICGNMEQFNSWLDQQRRAQADRPLVALVQEWGETNPCQASSLPSSTRMMQIPTGSYEIGHEQGDEYHLAATPIELNTFWIDSYEITNAEYRVFVDETGHAVPQSWPGGVYSTGRENHPVKGITWGDANAYCTWARKRLPTEREWEVAARGTGFPPSLYPWGNDSFAGGEINNVPREDTYEVGTFPFNRSFFNVYDMAANVWEWVGEPYGPIPEGNKILRGGRYGFLRDMAYRQPATPADPRFVEFAGFRCAADQVEGG